MSKLLDEFKELRKRQGSTNANVNKMIALIDKAIEEGEQAVKITAKDLGVDTYSVQTVYNALTAKNLFVEVNNKKRYFSAFKKTGKEGIGEVIETIIALSSDAQSALGLI